MLTQITRDTDPTADGRESARMRRNEKASRPARVYTTEFCPLLPAGSFAGVLGSFDSNAEIGFKLSHIRTHLGVAGKRTRKDGGAIVARIVKDMDKVVRKALNGEAVMRIGQEYLSFEDVEQDISKAESGT